MEEKTGILAVVLNGEQQKLQSLDEGANLEQVVSSLGLRGDRIAVELNGEIARRADWQRTAVRSGDKLEVVHFVGGGC